jgi:hypothetical protein
MSRRLEVRRLLVADSGSMRRELVKVREVVIRGRAVLQDKTGQVYCPSCQRFVHVEALCPVPR